MQQATKSRQPSRKTSGGQSVSQPVVIVGETVPVPQDSPEAEFDAVEAITRLLVGGTVELSDLLLQELDAWEKAVASRQTAAIIEKEEDAGDILRYLLIGMIFESQNRVRSSVNSVGGWILGAVSTTAAVARPITQSRLFSPARRGASAAASKFETEFARLIRIGRAEEFVGRLVAEEALQESVDWVMGYIAQDPAVRALVQQQAIGFSEEVTVGARERMITGDNILEGVVRRILGRKPRAELPGPPDEVQKQAALMAQEEQAPSP